MFSTAQKQKEVTKIVKNFTMPQFKLQLILFYHTLMTRIDNGPRNFKEKNLRKVCKLKRDFYNKKERENE